MTSPSPSGAEEPAVLMLDDLPDSAPEPRRRTGVALGVAGGLVAGVFLTWTALNASTPAPVDITPDSFPLEIMGMRREDFHARDLDHQTSITRLDEAFAKDLERFRFSHGAAGGTYLYERGGTEAVRLTIVNARQSLPRGLDDPTLLSYDLGRVRCTSHEFSGTSTLEVDPDTGEVIESQEAYYSRITCVLWDERRHVSLMLQHEYAAQQARPGMAGIEEEFAEALQTIHTNLP